MPVTKSSVLNNIEKVSSRFTDVVVGANPAAGAEISETVPTDQAWDLIAVRFTLVTSATAATRQSILTIDDGTNVIYEAAAPSTQAASLTQIYTFADVGQEKAVAQTRVLGMLPPLRLPAGFRVRTVTASIQAGDDYAAPVLYIVRNVY